MSFGAVAIEALVSESVRWSGAEEGIDSLLLDRPRMVWVREFAYHFTRLLNPLVHKHEVFPHTAAPLFLLDFDVVFEYLSVKGNVSERSLSVEAFFNSTDFSFALPLGSFLELLNWLNRAYLHLHPAERNYTPEETLQLLAQRLSVRYGAKAGTDAAQLAVQESLDDDIVQVKRLLDLLRTPRFKGVWGTFLESDKQKLLPYVRRIRRHDERQRDGTTASVPASVRKERRDQNDALNLAVTCHAVRSEIDEAVLLMTNTRPLADLPDQFSIDHPDFAKFQDGMDALLGLNGEPVAQHYPVVSPFDVWVWQLMRTYGSPHSPHALLISTRQAFNNLMGAIDEATAQHFDIAAITTARRQARDAIAVLARRAADKASPIGPFLQFSLSEAAVRQGRRLFALKQKETFAEEDEANKYIFFARLLQQLGSLLETDRVLRYELSPLPSASIAAQRFTIYFGKSLEYSLPIADGELYIHVPKSGLCVIRWPVICQVSTFLRAVRDVLIRRHIRPRTRRDKTAELKFVRVAAHNPLWRSGVVAYTSVGAWGTDLSLVFQPWTWEGLVERFRDGALYSLVDDPQLDSISNTGRLPEILSLRVNSEIGDFVYDIIPPDQEQSQFLTCLSHRPKVADVMKLMVRTSSSVVLETHLVPILKELFSLINDKELK